MRDCTAPSFSDETGFLPAVPGDVFSVGELVDVLRAAAARPPHVVHMDLPGNARVVIGIGGPWAAISWHHLSFGRGLPPHHPPSWYARPAQPAAAADVGFVMAERELVVPADRLLPAADVIRMAAYIAEHHTLPETDLWVDAQGNRYAGRIRAGAATPTPGPGGEGIPF